MNHLGISLLTQISLAIGLAGLLWPQKLMPVFDVLMFPWPSTYRMLRANSIGAIALSILLFVGMMIRVY
ncbi:MAG: hypothetical protein ACHP8A_02595 [Terriglobales bacterium]|jgi:hypothetical protein|nr:hypothetical protein [Terriglobales bacterium]